MSTYGANSEGGRKPSNAQRTPLGRVCDAWLWVCTGAGLALGPVSPRTPSNPAEPLSPGCPLAPCGSDQERDTIRTRPGCMLRE